MCASIYAIFTALTDTLRIFQNILTIHIFDIKILTRLHLINYLPNSATLSIRAIFVLALCSSITQVHTVDMGVLYIHTYTGAHSRHGCTVCTYVRQVHTLDMGVLYVHTYTGAHSRHGCTVRTYVHRCTL